MRKVAERLGRSAMALYTYVPGKAELLDLMLDTVYGEQPAPDRRAGRLARRRRGVGARRPGSSTTATRGCCRSPAAAPCSARTSSTATRRCCASSTALGLPAVEVARSANALAGFVRGAAQAVSDARAAEQATGVSDDDWWNARSPLLDEMVGDRWETRYPVVDDASSAEQAFDQVDRPDDSLPYTVRDAFDTFEFGLQRLLDGFAAHIAVGRRLVGPHWRRGSGAAWVTVVAGDAARHRWVTVVEEALEAGEWPGVADATGCGAPRTGRRCGQNAHWVQIRPHMAATPPSSGIGHDPAQFACGARARPVARHRHLPLPEPLPPHRAPRRCAASAGRACGS